MLAQLANEQTKEQLEGLGKESNSIKTAGCHLATITSAYSTDGGTWKSLTVEFETETGETAKLSEFFGIPKSSSAEDTEKANKANTRVMSIMTKLGKLIGIPDIKAGTTGAQPGTDAKGRTIEIYPKYAKKQLYVTTSTVISADSKDTSKVYVKQEVNPNKFLDKTGKDGMGRDVLESYAEEAKASIEIAYNDQGNMACLQKQQQLKEKAMGVVQPTTSAPATQASTATAQTAAPVEEDDDI
jgi:hypothetical protein